ncbi:hypothetical protein ADICYQ_5385 [Cyclobacterium qasimii M12-11B]|uniref:Uncharacterized protein n=1 Tax=Cyclobacterium qasimii M12-11B TaxID=641524 RepID=S7WFD8_9BACT|nr:hypothetical protein ADICYQ_5385 [Cyclobacterium qasimii M12-11B]
MKASGALPKGFIKAIKFIIGNRTFHFCFRRKLKDCSEWKKEVIFKKFQS